MKGMIPISRRYFGILFLTLLIIGIAAILLSTQTVRARTIYVDDDGGKDYTGIQEAINASSVGDTVYVYNGTYNESIIVNKTINLVGESNQGTIIKGSGISESKGIYVTVSYVSIRNMKIDNFYYGIDIEGSSNNNIITSNTITNCNRGIDLWPSSNNNITSNTVTNCDYGIIFFGSNNNITSNTVTNCSQGIHLYSSSNNTIAGNTVANCSSNGICLQQSSSNNNITSNTVTNCNAIGIYLGYSDYSSNNNMIIVNTVTNCSVGIYISSSSNNAITSNDIYSNKQYGLSLYPRTSNTAINNWWGNASGPYNPTSNPTGTGDNISDNIVFIPWATSPFNITTLPQTQNQTNNQTINQTNTPPSASIASISPNPAIHNQSVITFVGSGTDSDGTIVEYLWESSISGIIGSSATFTNNSLPVGNHTITFKVKDNNNTWSEPVSVTLIINTSGGNASITEKPPEPKKGFISGFESIFLLSTIGVLTFIFIRRRK